jgi:hypothetical protein
MPHLFSVNEKDREDFFRSNTHGDASEKMQEFFLNAIYAETRGNTTLASQNCSKEWIMALNSDRSSGLVR